MNPCRLPPRDNDAARARNTLLPVGFGLAGWLFSIVALAAGGPLEGFDADVGRALAATGTPGAAVAIVRNGAPIFLQGFGVRRVGSGDRVDPHTLFGIGSLTKAFTAADVGLLVDAGSIELDAPVTRYVPAFALLDAYRGQNATVRDLLAHRTGLGDTNWLTVNTTLTPETIVERLAFVVPDAGFREKYLYQNTMYMVLGQAIQHVSGLDWSTFTRERVLKPLGMSDTTTGQPPPSANVAVPHLVSGHVAHVIPPLDITNVAPAGAMYSSASDLTKWLDFQTREGKDGGLLSAAVLTEMHSPQTARKADPYLYPDATMVAYGLAWILWDYHGLRIVSHDGAIDGMTAKICLVPSLGLGIVVLANSEYSAVPNVLVFDSLDRLTAEVVPHPRKDWIAHFVPLVGMLLDERAAEASALAALIVRGAAAPRPVAGRYWSPLFGTVTISVTRAGGRIELLGRDSPLLALRDGTFAVDLASPGLEHADFRLRFGARAADPALTVSVAGHAYLLRREP